MKRFSSKSYQLEPFEKTSHNIQHIKAERRKWSVREDEQLITFIKKHGISNWKLAASIYKDRTAKQCRERWINHLDPSIVKGKLTTEEWEKVVHAQEELGNRWSEIAKLLPGRTPNQIKNVWHAMARREIKPKLSSFSHPGDGDQHEFSSCSNSEEEDGLNLESGEDYYDGISEYDFVVNEPNLKKRKSNFFPDFPIQEEEEGQMVQNPKISKLEALVEIALDLYDELCGRTPSDIE